MEAGGVRRARGFSAGGPGAARDAAASPAGSSPPGATPAGSGGVWAVPGGRRDGHVAAPGQQPGQRFLRLLERCAEPRRGPRAVWLAGCAAPSRAAAGIRLPAPARVLWLAFSALCLVLALRLIWQRWARDDADHQRLVAAVWLPLLPATTWA